MTARWFFLMVALTVFTGCGQNGWRSTETDHLILYFQPDSFAERALDQAVTEYEDSYQAARRLLPQVELEGKIKVYLHEGLGRMGFTRAAVREVHFRYDAQFRLTSMHEFLHVLLYQFNRRAPLRFEEGVCRVHEVRSVRDGDRTVPVPLVRLAKRMPAELWRVKEVFRDAYETDGEGNLAAAFAAFAIQEHGMDRFWEFYAQLREGAWQKPLEEYFDSDLASVEKRFIGYMNRLPDPPGQ